MRIDWFDKDEPIDVEMDCEELRVVKANRDGTYQLLSFDGAHYVLFTRAEIKAFKGYADEEGVIYKSTTKEIWESWGRDLPENTESEDE